MKTDTLFSKEAKKISLTARERDILREGIVSYMEYYPLRMPMHHRHIRSVVRYTKYITTLYSTRIISFRVITGTLALLFFITVPVIAEQALPGDTLYPVKVRFNEGIRSQLAFSPYEKMQWETKRVERRIAEARLLVKEGKLTEEKENVLEETVRSHAIAFQAQLAQLRESDATGAAIAEVTLESALDVQSAVLDTEIAHEASSTSPNEGDVNDIAAIVREARADVASSTDAASSNGIASYGRLSARIEENTTRIHALSQSLIEELTDAQKGEMEERTTQVNEAIVSAKKAHDKADNKPAVTLLREALATTEKLIAFMSSIDLRENVSLDTLVPKPPSDETRKAELEKVFTSLAEKYASLMVASGTFEEPKKKEYTEKLEILLKLLEKGKSEMAAGNFENVEHITSEAEELIADLEHTEQETQ